MDTTFGRDFVDKGSPDDGFLITTLKIVFKLSGVLFRSLENHLSGAINFVSVGHPRATLVFRKYLGFDNSVLLFRKSYSQFNVLRK